MPKPAKLTRLDTKPDFRKDMNTILEVFYKTEGTVHVIEEIKKFEIPYSDTIWMICKSLDRDGYINLFKGYSQGLSATLLAKVKYSLNKVATAIQPLD